MPSERLGSASSSSILTAPPTAIVARQTRRAACRPDRTSAPAPVPIRATNAGTAIPVNLQCVCAHPCSPDRQTRPYRRRAAVIFQFRPTRAWSTRPAAVTATQERRRPVEARSRLRATAGVPIQERPVCRRVDPAHRASARTGPHRPAVCWQAIRSAWVRARPTWRASPSDRFPAAAATVSDLIGPRRRAGTHRAFLPSTVSPWAMST